MARQGITGWGPGASARTTCSRNVPSRQSSSTTCRSARSRTGRFDHHGAAPYENLYTDILILQNAGDLFSCGGNRADEPNSGARTTLWNIRFANNSFPRYFHTAKFPQINIVGIEAWATQNTQTDAWIESRPGQTTRPPNLYEAQLTRRLASLGKKMHGSKPTARSGGQRLDP